MQMRWEEQLAGYVSASFSVLSLGNVATQSVQFVNKIVTIATLFFGAKLVIDGQLSVGELVAFNMLSARVSGPILRMAQIWQDFHQTRISVARLGDVLNAIPEPSYNPGPELSPRFVAKLRSNMLIFGTGSTVPRSCVTSASEYVQEKSLASWARRGPARVRSQN